MTMPAIASTHGCLECCHTSSSASSSRLPGSNIIAHAHIGPGLYIPHGGYIVVGGIRAGRNCNFYQGVTLGNSSTTFDNP